MIRSIRKATEFVYVAYGRDYDTLHAKEFTLQADEHRIVFSFDLSTNQREKNKSANRYIDVQRLLEHSDEVTLFEVHRPPKEKQTLQQDWLAIPLRYALKEYPNAATYVEARFLDGQTRDYKCSIGADEHRVIFNARSK